MPEPVGKRLIKVGISSAVALFDVASKALGRSPSARAQGVVLLYHDVPSGLAPAFQRQVEALRTDGRALVPLAQMSNPPPAGWNIAITFDDALSSFHDVALPVCKSSGAPVTLFVPPGLLGTAGYMSAGQVAQLPALVEVGAHGNLHRRLSTLSDDELRVELEESRASLTQLIGRPVTSVAYPFGDWDDRVRDAAHAAGYHDAHTVRPACRRADDDPFALPRVTVEPTDWPLEFRLKCMGAYRWMGVLMALRRRFLSSAV